MKTTGNNLNTPQEGINEVFEEDRFFRYWYPYPGYKDHFDETGRFGLLVWLFKWISKSAEESLEHNENKPWFLIKEIEDLINRLIKDFGEDHPIIKRFLIKVLHLLKSTGIDRPLERKIRPIFSTWLSTNNSINENSVRVASNYVGQGNELKGKTRIVRINAFFLRLNTLLGTDKALRDGYIYKDKVRRALLTSGALLFYKLEERQDGEKEVVLKEVLNFDEFICSSITDHLDLIYKILSYHESDDKFVDFWGGGKMEIPNHVLTAVDQNIYMLKLEVFSRGEVGRINNPRLENYFLVHEHPLHLNYTLIGDDVSAKYGKSDASGGELEEKEIPEGFSVNSKDIGNQYFGEYFTRIHENKDNQFIYVVKCPLFNPELDLLTSVQLYEHSVKDKFHEIRLSST